MLVGMRADCDDVVETDVSELVDVLGPLAGDVDPGFGHDLDRAPVEAMRLDAARVGLEHLAP